MRGERVRATPDAFAKSSDTLSGARHAAGGDAEDAARELERRVKTLGFKGTMLCGRVGARNLDDPSLTTIFQSAEA